MKKFLAAALAASLLFAFVSCGDVDSGVTSSTSKKTTSSSGYKGVYGLLTGVVVDSYNGNPVEGVTVSIEGTDWKYETGADGTYYMDKVIPGTYTVIYYKDGYRANAVETEVNAKQYLEDDPFDKHEVLTNLLGLAKTAIENDATWSSTVIKNGALGSSSNAVITTTDNNGIPTTVENGSSSTTSGNATVNENTFDFAYFLDQVDDYVYTYGITANAVKLVKTGATVKGTLIGYIPHGNDENFETEDMKGTGYAKEQTKGTKVALSGVEVFAYAQTSGDEHVDTYLKDDAWKTTTDENGNFELKDLPVGTQMRIGVSVSEKTIDGTNYRFTNSNISYSDTYGVTPESKKTANNVTTVTPAYFTTLDSTTYSRKGEVEVDNILNLQEVYVKAAALAPYVVATNAYATGDSTDNPFVGTGMQNPIKVTDAVTVTFNQAMDPTEFAAFYSDKVMNNKVSDTGVLDSAHYSKGEKLVATWDADYKTVSLKRAGENVFAYDKDAGDAPKVTGYIAFDGATAKNHMSSEFNSIEIYTVKAMMLKEVSLLKKDEVPTRTILDDTYVPYLGAVKLTFTKPVNADEAKNFVDVWTSARGTTYKQSFAGDWFAGKTEADANSIYVKFDNLEKSSYVDIGYRIYSTDYKDYGTNLKDDYSAIADDTAEEKNHIKFNTNDGLTLVSTNLYGDPENVYYNDLSTGDFNAKIFKTTEDIVLTFTEALPANAIVTAELYEKAYIDGVGSTQGIKLESITDGTPSVSGKTITIKHKDLELDTEYALAVKVVSDGVVWFNTKSTLWAKLYTVNGLKGTSGYEYKNGELSNVALTMDALESKDAESCYIWFKTADTAELKLYESSHHDYDVSFETGSWKAVYSYTPALADDVVLTFTKAGGYGLIPAFPLGESFKINLVEKGSEENLVTDFQVSNVNHTSVSGNDTLKIKHEPFEYNKTYLLTVTIYDNDGNEIFTTIGAKFAGKEEAVEAGDAIEIKTLPFWQLVKTNLYNYGADENGTTYYKYAGIDSVTSITGTESKAVFGYKDNITFEFADEIDLTGKTVIAWLFKQSDLPGLNDVPPKKLLAEKAIQCVATSSGKVLTLNPEKDLEVGGGYYLFVSVVDGEYAWDEFPAVVLKDYHFFTINPKTAAENFFGVKFDNASKYLVSYQDPTQDQIFIQFKVAAKEFVLKNTNLVQRKEEENIYYTLNATTQSTARGFEVGEAITLTFEDDIPDGAVVEAELYPANIIDGLGIDYPTGNAQKFLDRNVVTGTSYAQNVVTIAHSALIPATRYALAVKISAPEAGYADFNTKNKSVVFYEEDTDGDGTNDYWLTDAFAEFGTDLDNTATSNVSYFIFDTEDGLTAVEGEDYATNFKLDGSTTDFVAKDATIKVELNTVIPTGFTPTYKVFWGDTLAAAQAKSDDRVTYAAATSVDATVKNGTTTVVTFESTGDYLVPGYFYDVEIVWENTTAGVKLTKDYVFQVSSDDVQGRKLGAAHLTLDNSTVDSGTTKVNATFAADSDNLGLADRYRYFYAYGTTSGVSADIKDWVKSDLTIDNPDYFEYEYNDYTKLYKDVEFAPGKETKTGKELPWIQISGNVIGFFEQYVTASGFLNYAEVPCKSGTVISDNVPTEVTITATNNGTAFVAGSAVSTSTPVVFKVVSNTEIIKITGVTYNGSFTGSDYVLDNWSADKKSVEVKVTASAGFTAAVGDGITVIVEDLAGNSKNKDSNIQ